MTLPSGIAVALEGAVGFFGALLVVPLARQAALELGITDKPAPHKFHRVPTPYLGGLAVGITLLLGEPLLPHWSLQVVTLTAATVVLTGMGLLDDARTVGPLVRLTVEIGAAAVLYVSGVGAHLFHGPSDLVVTVLWVVGLVNAFNLLDNMDGALGSVAAVTAGGLLLSALLHGQVLVAALAAVLGGTCIGFLVHNWPPAKVFMGDAGSLPIGFLLAEIGLKLRPAMPAGRHAVGLLLLFALPVFDTALVIVSRARAHRPVYIGGTDHSSHRLVRLGFPTPVAVMMLALASAVSCGFGAAVLDGALPVWPVVAPAVVLTAIAFIGFLRVSVGYSGEPPLTEADEQVVDLRTLDGPAVEALT